MRTAVLRTLAEKPGHTTSWTKRCSFQSNSSNNNNQDGRLLLALLPMSSRSARNAAGFAASRARARSTPRRMDFAARLTIHSSDSDSDGSTQPDDTEPDTGACSLR